LLRSYPRDQIRHFAGAGQAPDRDGDAGAAATQFAEPHPHHRGAQQGAAEQRLQFRQGRDRHRPLYPARIHAGLRCRARTHPHYWGQTPPWSEVLLRIITNGGARLAALLSGDLDLAEQVPYDSVER